MSLKPQTNYVGPEDTAKVAQAIFPEGSVYLRLFDTFGTLFEDTDFSTLFPQEGQPAEAPFRLMLVLLLQFIENLTDRQAADAVRTRIDWKYLLLPAAAWVLGLGRPGLVLQAYSLLNVASWIVLACLLLRWLPVGSARTLAAWAACLFSPGMLASVRSALPMVRASCCSSSGSSPSSGTGRGWRAWC